MQGNVLLFLDSTITELQAIERNKFQSFNKFEFNEPRKIPSQKGLLKYMNLKDLVEEVP